MQVTMKFVFYLIFSLLLQFYIAFLDETPAIYEYQCILWHQLWYFIGHKSEKSHHIKQQHDILWLLSLINDLLSYWLCPWSLAEIRKGQKGGQKAEWQDFLSSIFYNSCLKLFWRIHGELYFKFFFQIQILTETKLFRIHMCTIHSYRNWHHNSLQHLKNVYPLMIFVSNFTVRRARIFETKIIWRHWYSPKLHVFSC